MRKNRVTRLLAIAVIALGMFVCAPFSITAALEIKERLRPEDMWLVLGGMYTLLVMVVSISVMSLFVYTYSRLRSREDSEDDRRERELLRTTVALMGNTRTSYNVKVPSTMAAPFAQPYQLPPQLPANWGRPNDQSPLIEYVEREVELE